MRQETRDERARARAMRTGKAVFLRKERKQGWRAALPVYVIWCDACRTHTESHLAGYGRITCAACRRHTVRRMTWRRFRDKELRPFLAMAPFFILVAMLGIMLILLCRRLAGG